MNYGPALKLVRQYHRVSQTELKEIFGYASQSALTHVEVDFKPPSLDMLNRYTNWLEVSLSSLIGFVEAMNGMQVDRVLCPKMSRVLQWYKDTHA